MIQEGLYNKDFCEKWVYGLDALTERASHYTPEVVEKITWIPADKIIAAARYIGNAGVTTLQWGLPLDQTKWAVGASQAVAAVQVLTGNIDVPGGFVNVKYGHVQSDIRENICKGMGKEVREGRLGDGKYALRTVGFGPHSMGDDILLAMETDEPYPIKMLFLCSTNTFINMGGESKRIYNAMQRVPFIVVCDIFMTPTAAGCADLVLPIAMGCERWGIRAWFTPLRAINKVLQTGEAKGDEQIMLELGNILNPDMFFWDDVEEMNEYMMNNLSAWPFKVSWDELQQKTVIYPKFQYRKYETGDMRFDHQPGFNTTTGRIELYCTMYDQAGIDPLPFFKEPMSSPIASPEEAKEYPFVLSTGRRSWEFFHSEHRQLKRLREFHPWPLCEINPEDAEPLGIKDGDWVYLENQFGKCMQKALVTAGQLKGTIMAEHGWWFPERSGKAADGLFGAFDSNINNLTIMNDMATAGYGSSYKTQLCKVYKVTDGKEPKTELPQDLGRNRYEIVNQG
jgi:anaerobic selenocysteine-containing dehydrogenase